jgi:DNA-binding GntR family transcriptional regulator
LDNDVPPKEAFRSKKEFVYHSLHEEILNGELKPGARLVIDELSAKFNVSPIPVREALQQLQSDGLVTIEPYIGARVTEIHQGLIHEIFALLEALEIISGQAACQLMTDIDLAEMELLLRRMDTHANNPEQWSRDNIQLHQFICERAGMSLVQEIFLRIGDHWDRLRRYYLEDVSARRIAAAQQDHWKLLEALRTRNPEYVAEVIRAHNRNALADYLTHLASNGQIDQAATDMPALSPALRKKE